MDPWASAAKDDDREGSSDYDRAANLQGGNDGATCKGGRARHGSDELDRPAHDEERAGRQHDAGVDAEVIDTVRNALCAWIDARRNAGGRDSKRVVRTAHAKSPQATNRLLSTALAPRRIRIAA